MQVNPFFLRKFVNYCWEQDTIHGSAHDEFVEEYLEGGKFDSVDRLNRDIGEFYENRWKPDKVDTPKDVENYLENKDGQKRVKK